ncbi:cytochrome P450 [Streptomyces sp. NPDC057271]|uniref:cytochrome P450 n=1 Tax=unclassified Streptomyces TaxID=2593676 RepID=UPI003633249C
MNSRTALEEAPLDAMQRLLEPENRRNPYPFLEWLRTHDPVHRTTTGSYLLSRHADVSHVLQESGTVFVSPDRSMLEARYPEALRRRSVRIFAGSIALTNPPEHTRLRKVLSRDFTARRVDVLRPRIARICDRLLDEVAEPLLDGETVDLHRTVAEPLSVATIADLLGVPEGDRAWLSSLVEGVLSAHPEAPDEVLAVADKHCSDMEDYLGALIAQRRRDPRDDLVTALAKKVGEGTEELEDSELIPMIWALWCAGFKTSAAGISNGVLAMLENPQQLTWLRKDQGDVAAFVNETLRYDPPTTITPFLRFATRDVEFPGGTVPAGSSVRLLLGAANRDPEVFPDPDRFDPARETKASLGFAGGIHFCVGAGLARAELGISLPRIHARFPRLAAASEPVWSDAVFHHMVRELPLVVKG